MRNLIVGCVVALFVSGCLPEDPVKLDSNGNRIDSGSGDASLSVDLVLTTSSASSSDFPYAVKASITGSKGAQYTLKVGNTVIESGSMPTVGMRDGGPFSGTESDLNVRLAYFVIANSGSTSVTVELEKDGEVATDTETVNAGTDCQANQNFYANYVGSSTFNQCTGCHTQQPDNSNFDTLKTWNKVQNNSDPYLVANAPAEVDLTPAPTLSGITAGGQYSHSDGQKWTPDSGTHLRVLELVYRMRNDFSCP